MTARFPGRCLACKGAIVVGEAILYTRGVGATHATTKQCAAAKQVVAQSTPTLDLGGMVKFLQDAVARGLKRPKLRILHMDQQTELTVSLTTKGVAPGSLAIVGERDGFIGCIRPDGRTTSSLATNHLLQTYLVQVARDPVTAAKHYSALKCACSFCGKPLEDAGSVQVGYGPVCAKNWGLPHSPMGVTQLGSKEVVQ